MGPPGFKSAKAGVYVVGPPGSGFKAGACFVGTESVATKSPASSPTPVEPAHLSVIAVVVR